MFRSGENLFQGALEFIEQQNSISIFSAYTMRPTLEKLNSTKKVEHIVVRWDTRDLITGIADLSIYEYCRANGIILYRNPRLHLKVILGDDDALFHGSANVTGRGLEERGKSFNYELSAVTNISIEEQTYLKKILFDSQLVDEQLFSELEEYVKANRMEVPDEKEPFEPTQSSATDFLISHLPMSHRPDQLWSQVQEYEHLDALSQKCIVHDLSLFELNPTLDEAHFVEEMKTSFNSNRFVQAFKEAIVGSEKQEFGYGESAAWISENTTTVPTPRNWELKQRQVVNILFEWLSFCDPNFMWHIYSYRQNICYLPITVTEIPSIWESEISALNIGSARGSEAPHQPILLLSLLDQFHRHDKEYNIQDLIDAFTVVWNKYDTYLMSDNPDIVMPIKALLRKGILNAQFKNNSGEAQINETRSVSELGSQIEFVYLNDALKKALDEMEDIRPLKKRLIGMAATALPSD